MDETENVTEISVNVPLSFDDESVVYDEVQEFTQRSVHPAAHSQFSGDQVAPIELKVTLLIIHQIIEPKSN